MIYKPIVYTRINKDKIEKRIVFGNVLMLLFIWLNTIKWILKDYW